MRTEIEPETTVPAEPGFPSTVSVPAWRAVLLGAAAGGLGWGIRGQYGHETGAMIAGLLVSVTLLFLLFRHAPASTVIRAVAFATVGIGFGGAMTYGQTVGLTHDSALVGNGAALRWGMLGLAIKGGIWIGFFGLFLGIGLSGRRYRPIEIAALFAGMALLFTLGTLLLNSPFDPANRVLPRIYFSDDWRWEPDAVLKPRREVWGGLLFALAGAVAYARWVRKDTHACRLALWAMLGGALGFPLGQSVQTFHAWNLDLFRSGVLATIDPKINWWNFMETTFGAVFGAVVGWGVWRQRNAIMESLLIGQQNPANPPSLQNPHAGWSLVLLALHTALLAISEFGNVRGIDRYTDFPLVMGLLPILAALLHPSASWLVALPITLMPIAGKTLRYLLYEQASINPVLGWCLFVIVPISAATVLALVCHRTSESTKSAELPFRWLLAASTLIYFGLNFAFFRFPWPWNDWTPRTPNALVFTLCAFALVTTAFANRSPRDPSTPTGCRALGSGPSHSPETRG